jgi:hypothetical protein
MFPKTQYLPPRPTKRLVRFDIALNIPRQLGLPKRSIAFWDYAVKRTLMPEAAINEDGQVRSLKHQIRFGTPNAQMKTIPKTDCPYGAPQFQLRRCVPATYTRHQFTTLCDGHQVSHIYSCFFGLSGLDP